MTRPECTGCEDPHRSRRIADWTDTDFEEFDHFNAMDVDRMRKADPDDARLARIAAGRHKTTTTTATGVSR